MKHQQQQSVVLLPAAVRQSLDELIGTNLNCYGETVPINELLPKLVNGAEELSIACFTADQGLVHALGENLQELVRGQRFRLLGSSLELVTLRLAQTLAGCLVPESQEGTSDLGERLRPVLRITNEEEQRLHAKVYMLRLKGTQHRLAIIGSANATHCGLYTQQELSTLLIEDPSSKPLFDWLTDWFNRLWETGRAYTPPPTSEHRDHDDFEPLLYQEEVLNWLNERWERAPERHAGVYNSSGVRLPGHLVVLPTGCGKTRLTIEWIRSRWEAGDEIEVLWVTHLRELVQQTKRKFGALCSKQPEGRRHRDGESHDGKSPSSPSPVDVLTRRQAAKLPTNTKVDLLVIDEAHHLGLDGIEYPEMLRNIKARMVIGLTATPWRTSLNGKMDPSLPMLFPEDTDHRIAPLTLKQAVDPAHGQNGKPILPRLYRHVIDTGVELSLDDKDATTFKVGNSANFKPFLTREAVKLVATAWYPALGKTLVFALTKRHADDIAEALVEQHPEAQVLCVHSDCDREVQDRNLRTFKGANEDASVILVSVGMLLEGMDFPDARTVMMARPTRSTLLYTQMLGRVLRGPAMKGTEEAYAVEFFLRTKEDRSKRATHNRNEVFHKSLLGPPRGWGEKKSLPNDVKVRVESARKGLLGRTQSGAGKSNGRQLCRLNSSDVRITRNQIQNLRNGLFGQIARLTRIGSQTLQVYCSDQDKFKRWKDNNQSKMKEVRKILGKSLTGSGNSG
jgi:superfamily II DNA or RNA helicase